MDSNGENKRRRFRYRGSLLGPIILVTIGVVFLLNNLGYLAGDVWDIILKLWPLLLLAIGLDSALQGRGVTGPLIFIGLGVAFLLSNFGLISWNIWELLLKLWPIFLIAIGLDLLISKRSTWGALLAVAILIAILIGALWYFGSFSGISSEESIEIVQQLDKANHVDVFLKTSIAGINIGSLASSEFLLEGSIYQRKGETVHKEYQVVDGKGDFHIYSESISIDRPSLSSQAVWDLDFSTSIPLTFDFGLGAGEFEVDMQSMMINEFFVDVAVGKIIITLPTRGRLSGEVNNPIGSITIKVPATTALRLKAETGLTNIQVPIDYQKEDKFSISPGYSSADNRVDLIVNQAIGLVRIEIGED
jgi:hypothetical protein